MQVLGFKMLKVLLNSVLNEGQTYGSHS
jgi:hypothetical protein